MMRLHGVVCVLLLIDLCHAAAILSNGTGGGTWSEPATWATQVVPGNGDTVTILAGDVVTFDVDMSGWEHGIAGLTCNGTMDCSTSPGGYYLKTSADIGGTGRILCGSYETAYPSDCVMTFDFDSKPNSFECGTGLTLALHCTRPDHPVVFLSAAVESGQTEMSVDTDVTGDIWTPGSTIRIDGASGSVPDSEERVIGIGAVASGDLAVDVGLANAKAPGGAVVLVTRNIRIVGSTDSAVKSMRGGVLGCEISRCTRGASSCVSSTISGTVSGCTYGVYSLSACLVSGTISGCSSGVSLCSGNTISGTISGCTYGAADVSGCQVSGMISGCAVGIYRASGCLASGAVFGGNNYDLRRIDSLWAYDALFGSATECYEYDTDMVPRWSYVASYRHDGAPDAFRAWTRGGVIESDASVAPSGYPVSYRHMCTSAATPCFRQELITVGPGQTLDVWGKILILDKHDVQAPRLEVVDITADPLVYADASALASAVIPNPLGRYTWQDVTVRYTNTGKTGKQVWIRCSTHQPGNDVYEVWRASLL